ncbi:glycosyltransferase family 2 protein [Leptolyngbya sp. DQ-M1]|uniref:glycosyltransferase n=1 Tax=Leptolyngbya sp. DQ-M1 TaxID=2933920 RepID=UPI00329A0515
MPILSVIIPTYNRCDSLKRTLNALARQTFPLEQVEVIVVADGCSDDTLTMLATYAAPFALKVIEQPGQGAAVARNQGAAQASANLLLFLDDDIEATACLLEAHFTVHDTHSEKVVLGYLAPVIHSQSRLFRSKLRIWLEAMFEPMRQPGYRYSYRNLLTGNVSLRADLFNRVGGFDPTFKCHEDYELGIRLIEAGAAFHFSEEAMGYHHEMTDLNRSLRRKYQEGIASIQLGRKYPEFIATFPVMSLFTHPESWLYRVLPVLVFQFPRLCDGVAVMLRSCLNFLEGIRAYGYWQMLLDRLLGYWYLRGMVHELGNRSAFAKFIRFEVVDTHEGFELELNLQEGLQAAEEQLDRYRPASVSIRYEKKFIAQFPAKRGLERLRGRHLRSLLATTSGYSLTMALALAGVTQPEIMHHLPQPEQLQPLEETIR